MKILRDYQENAKQLVRESFAQKNKRVVLCMPTGAGKTATAVSIAKDAINKGGNVFFITERKSIFKQIRQEFTDMKIPYGVNRQYNEFVSVNIFMLQTLINMLSKHELNITPTLIILDEAHMQIYNKLIVQYMDTYIIGLTATPLYVSKEMPMKMYYNDIVVPVQISELIERGSLTSPNYDIYKVTNSKYKLDSKNEFNNKQVTIDYLKSSNIAILKRAYEKHKGRRTLIYVNSIEVAEEVKNAFEGSYTVHSKNSDSDNSKALKALFEDENTVVINVDVLTKGFDCPAVENIILYRATNSLPLYLQMCGRGSRIYPNKYAFNIIDLGGNVNRFGEWHKDRDWKSIFYEPRRIKEKKGEPPLKECPKCYEIILSSLKYCPECAHKFLGKKEDITLDNEEIKTVPEHLQKPYKEYSISDWIERQKIGNCKTSYKPAWVLHQIKLAHPNNYKDMINKYIAAKGYNSKWLKHQKI